MPTFPAVPATRHRRHAARFSVSLIPVLLLGITPCVGAQGRVTATGDSTSRQWISGITIPGDNDDGLRTKQLRDSSSRRSLFRATSSLNDRLPGATGRMRGGFVPPRIHFVHNADLPYSINDGALWAGRGANTGIVFGGRIERRNVRLFVLPELALESNTAYDTAISPNFSPRPTTRNPWSSPFQVGSQSIDLPIRFGDAPRRKLYPGQSALVIGHRSVEVGAATENEWWGPGVRNALLISNNAPGFPHLFARSAQPIMTPVGAVEARWIAGGLRESDFFDFTDDNDLRSIALLGVTLQPKWVGGLTVGAGRSVFAPASKWSSALAAFADVFRDVGQPDARPITDTTTAPGPDQLFSLFALYALPASGFEAYAEWGRAEFPKSLRDFLEQPNHAQGYTLGVQWLGEELTRLAGRIRIQAEATYVEQSPTFRTRPMGSWYTSSAAIQGYTNQGQPLGAGIGPGSSSQFVASDFLTRRWSLGGYANRIRWMEDAHSQGFPLTIDGANGWCEHDVSLLGGIRARTASRFGEIRADFSTGWRYNVFFKHAPFSCPHSTGTDVRTRSLSIRFAPSVPW